MSVVTDIVAISNYHKTMEKVAELACEFYRNRYTEYPSVKQYILNYDHPQYDEIQTGPKVGGANIFWFTLNHQNSDDFVSLLRSNNVTDVTLWIDCEYGDGPEVVTF